MVKKRKDDFKPQVDFELFFSQFAMRDWNLNLLYYNVKHANI